VNTQTPAPESSRVLSIIESLQTNGSEILPVAKVVDTLLDARGLATGASVLEAIDRELKEISARPSLVTAEEAAAIVSRIGDTLRDCHAT
jgi:hypothetical protein